MGGGALLCSACSGVLLLAETDLLTGMEATIHWAFASTFERNFPRVRLRVDEVLIVAGARQELVMSGVSASWHDLVLYLIARHISAAAALRWQSTCFSNGTVMVSPPILAFPVGLTTATRW